MDKRIFIAAALLLGISIGIFIILANAIKGFLKNKNRVFIYCLISIIVFSLTALLGFEGLIEDPMTLLIAFQICFLVYGIANYLSIKHFFDWAESKDFLDKLGFTLFVSFISLIPFLFTLKMVNDQGYHFMMLTSAILFITPLFFFRAFDAAAQMPSPTYKSWYFIPNKNIQNNSELFKEHFLVSLILFKKITSDIESNFRVRAPGKMKVGDFFSFFLESNQDKSPDSEIDYVNKYNKSYGWLFYKKSKWNIITGKSYIDPELTIAENNIKENSVIVCERTNLL